MALKDIIKKKAKPNISMWFLFAASGVIIIFFLWYFLIYVNGNERLLIQKSFRILTQIGENFKGREASLRGLVKSEDMKNKLTKYHVGHLFHNHERFGSFEQAKTKIKAYYSKIVIDKDTLNKDFFYFKNDSNFIRNWIYIYASARDRLKITDSFKIYFSINKKDFFEPIEREDVFDEIIIIKENQISDSNNTYEFIYSSFPGDINVKNLDSLIAIDEGLSSGIIKDIELSGIEYVLFMKQVQLQNNESYFVASIINKENYVRQIRSINVYAALLLLIIFFIILFSIPLIKLRMISENLQLKVSDLLLSVLSIIFGTFFTFVIILSLFSQYHREEKVDESLTNLSNLITTAFKEEIINIDATLNIFMEVSHKRDSLRGLTQKRLLVPEKDEYEVKENDTKDNFYLSDLPYQYYKFIFNLDTTGQQKAQTSSRQKPVTSWDNYSFRRYFKESGEWELDSLPLMLDFIVSNTSGEKLGVVSKRNEDFIYVITSRLYSVINTILPSGYGFCVIDKKGDVKFHSNSKRMLQENFIEESENSSDLKQAIYGNLSTHFSANYIGKNHLCYVQPINSLPLYLVTFYDQSYLSSVNLKITNLTFLFSLLVLAMFFLIVIGSRAVNYNKTELNRNLDLFDWLKPYKRKIEKTRNIYIANVIAIILMIAACIISNPENVILIIFLFIITQIVTNYCYMNYISWDNFRKNYLKGLLFPSVLIISLLLYFAFNALPYTYIYEIFVFNSLLIAANFIVIRISANIFSGFKDNTHFHIYFFSWLSLIVIAPVFIFFITFYNHEVKSEIAHNLYTYAKKEAVRNYNIDKFYHDNVQKPFHEFKDSLKNKGIYYLRELNRSDSTEFYTLIKDSIEETMGQILFYLKPDLDQQSSERKSLVKKMPGFSKYSTDSVLMDSVLIKYTDLALMKFLDSVFTQSPDSVLIKYPNSFLIKHPDSFLIKLLDSVLTQYPDAVLIKYPNSVLIKHPASVFIKYKAEQIHYSNTDSSNVAYYKGEIDKFGLGKKERWISFIVIILFFCYIFFKLLKFVSDKISTSSIEISLVKVKFRDKINEHINSKNNLMVQFSSAAEMKAYNNKKDEEKYFSKISYTSIEYDELHPHYFDSFKESNDRILIQDIHIDFKTPQADCEKLSIINNISEDDKIQLTLMLDCSFTKIIDDIEHSIELEEDEERLKLLKSLQKILISMNNKFVHLFPPLTENESIAEDEEAIEGKSTLDQVITVIKDELRVSDYLKWKYEQSIENYAAKKVEAEVPIPQEKIILKIQEYAMVYYESIWEACSNSEKILLYDISDDLLLNDKNKKVIKILLYKGLLKYNGYIDIMNRSFRNFIVTKFESEYKEEYIKKYESSGKWRSYRAPILLIVLALAFFIALQENILSNITSMLPVIIAALGIITKVSGIFSKSDLLTTTSGQSN